MNKAGHLGMDRKENRLFVCPAGIDIYYEDGGLSVISI
jgi:hypothetical protein